MLRLEDTEICMIFASRQWKCWRCGGRFDSAQIIVERRPVGHKIGTPGELFHFSCFGKVTQEGNCINPSEEPLVNA